MISENHNMRGEIERRIDELERKRMKWKEEVPFGPCEKLSDSIDDILTTMFETTSAYTIAFETGNMRYMQGEIKDLEYRKESSKRLRYGAISEDERLETLFSEALHRVLLHDVGAVIEIMKEGLRVEEMTEEEKDDLIFRLDDTLMAVDKAWKIPLWRLYCECKKLREIPMTTPQAYRRNKETVCEDVLLSLLWAYGDVFVLEQLSSILNIPKAKTLADELFSLLLDDLFVRDFPEVGIPSEITEKLKKRVMRAKSAMPELIDILNRGELPRKATAYDKELAAADGILSGEITKLCYI